MAYQQQYGKEMTFNLTGFPAISIPCGFTPGGLPVGLQLVAKPWQEGPLLAAALAYEILLMRLFSIVLWHHFAYMIISLALLGYGASGALLTLAPRAVRQHFAPLFSAAAAAFGVGAIGCFALAQQVPFNPLEILWDARQPAYLMAVYLLLALPFLCAGACVGMALSRFPGMLSRIYSFDILGAGVGSLGVVAFLQFDDLVQTSIVCAVTFAITALEGFLLTPMLMGRAAQMNPVAIFIGLLFWSWMWGIWGTVLAVPMLMMLKAVCDHVEDLQPIGELLGE